MEGRSKGLERGAARATLGARPHAESVPRPRMTDAAAPAHQGRFFRDFLRLAGPFWTTGPQRWRARVWTFAMALLGAAQVGLAIRLNLWNADFFDALERRSMDRFLTQIGIFAAIVAAAVLTNAFHMVARRRLCLAWREWLTHRVVGNWMEEARHYQVAQIPGDHDNPDGRIAEDIRIATEHAVDLAHSLLYATLLLVTFVGVLWTLSGGSCCSAWTARAYGRALRRIRGGRISRRLPAWPTAGPRDGPAPDA